MLYLLRADYLPPVLPFVVRFATKKQVELSALYLAGCHILLLKRHLRSDRFLIFHQFQPASLKGSFFCKRSLLLYSGIAVLTVIADHNDNTNDANVFVVTWISTIFGCSHVCN